MKLISMAKSHLLHMLPLHKKSTLQTIPEIDPNSYSLEKFKLYETRAEVLFNWEDRTRARIQVVYSPQEIKNLLQRIDEGNRATGGLNPVAKVFGIAG
ncbi:hypothetical protein Pint_10604 [Pistacia integerrima]|uniref:Uncharacterized protein n=1 Tax=Pistacia integerrima TaxID=434235 RepID=A0ACC0XLC3_9ROSI|nr:hypothetical protein Pint_10604 [Pistacia integerrima]